MTSILKPGLLVSVKTTIRGGVTYERQDLEPDTTETAPGAEVARWETTRVITDPEENARAVEVRGKAGGIVRRQCAATSFGLLCPSGNEPALDAAIAEARELAKGFNETAAHSTLAVYVLKGRIAETDEEATRALASEVADLLEQMERGVRDLDVKSIRDAATRARNMGAMLEADQAATVASAIGDARKAARAIVKRVEKGGEGAAEVLADLNTGAIERARFAFLEIGKADEEPEPDESDEERLPPVSPQRFAEIGEEW